jgi:hypothetical protein
MGGKECLISKEAHKAFDVKAGRCLTKASHIINIKYITATTEIIEPNLAIKFQNINLSG